MSYKTVQVSIAEGVAKVVLNRPDVLNALNGQLLDELNTALKDLETDPQVRCVVVTGSGRAFCAGADLGELRSQYLQGTAPDLGDSLRRRFNPIVERIRRMEKPVIALVNGAAAGAGLGIAMACDIKIASDKATFVEAFAKVGLVPDSGTSFFLPRLLGVSKAMELAFTGQGIDASTAEKLGLVNKVVEHDELEKAGLEMASKLAAGPTRGFGLSKKAINRALESGFQEALQYEAYLQEIAGRTRDHREGVVAFFEKRKPTFNGT